MFILHNIKRFALCFLICLSSAGLSAAQTSLFTYQGRLTDSTIAANGTYEMLFTLFDAGSGGTQIGSPLGRTVIVTNGIFTVNNLSFGSPLAFSGATRFLEIAVKPQGSVDPFTILAPRQLITSAPYAIRSLNATTADTATNSTQLGGIEANQFVTGQVVRSLNGLNNNVTLAAGSNITITPTGNTLTIASTGGGSGGILNQTTLQSGANFNIDGTGTANIINAATQYNIGGIRVLDASGFGGNIFVGIGAGIANTGINNSFVGGNAGQTNTTGDNNSFFGRSAGLANSTGSDNSFFGRSAGLANSTGFDNSFFGRSAGDSNTTGIQNSFFGRSAGDSNSTGASNSFLGTNAGQANTTGSSNSFFGRSAGASNTMGGANSFFGTDAGDSNTEGNNNSFFGRSAGLFNTTGSNNSFFGITSGDSNTEGNNNSFFGRGAGGGNVTGANNTIIGFNANVGSGNLTFATAIGAGAVVRNNNTIVLGREDGSDTVRVFGLGAAGNTSLCRNIANQISTCTAGNRSEQNNSENAAKLNALQTQNAQMLEQLKQQQLLIEGLKKLVCAQNPTAAVCQ